MQFKVAAAALLARPSRRSTHPASSTALAARPASTRSPSWRAAAHL